MLLERIDLDVFNCVEYVSRSSKTSSDQNMVSERFYLKILRNNIDREKLVFSITVENFMSHNFAQDVDFFRFWDLAESILLMSQKL